MWKLFHIHPYFLSAEPEDNEVFAPVSALAVNMPGLMGS